MTAATPTAAAAPQLTPPWQTALDGFDLVDELHAIHIVFPRGW